jgi:hypothetical protein
MSPSQPGDLRDRFDRRTFCRVAGVATAVGAVEASLGGVFAHADLTKEQRDKMTPDEIIQQMKAGNERFRSGKPQHRDLMREAQATAKGQYPAAIVFGCVDSRAPAELILDFGIGISSAVAWQGTSLTRTYWAVWNSLARRQARKWCLSWVTPPAAQSRVPLTGWSLAISRRCWQRFVRLLKPLSTLGSARPKTTSS